MKLYVKVTLIVMAVCILVFAIKTLITEEPTQLTQGEDFIVENESKIEIDYEEMLLPLRNSEMRKTPITHVMIHFISNVAENPENPFLIEEIYQVLVEYGVSTHYLIDREGRIYLLVEEDRVAYHAGPGHLVDFPEYDDHLNYYSIGIELMAIGTKKEMEEYIDEETYDNLDPSFIGFTDAQYEALQQLLEYIHERYPGIERNRQHVIGHDEYAPERKNDTGSLFDWTLLYKD